MGAVHPGHEGVLAVERGLGGDAHVDHRGGIEGRGGCHLDAADVGENALGVAQVARGEDRAGLALDRCHLEFPSDHVVGERALDGLRDQHPVGEHPLVLPELDDQADVRRDPALDALVEGIGQGPEQHDVNGHLMVVEEDIQVADTQLGARRRGDGERQRRRNEMAGEPQGTHTADGPL